MWVKYTVCTRTQTAQDASMTILAMSSNGGSSCPMGFRGARPERMALSQKRVEYPGADAEAFGKGVMAARQLDQAGVGKQRFHPFAVREGGGGVIPAPYQRVGTAMRGSRGAISSPRARTMHCRIRGLALA